MSMRKIAAILLLLNLNGCATLSPETRLTIGFSAGVIIVPGIVTLYDYFHTERPMRINAARR